MYTYRIASYAEMFLKHMLRQVSRAKPPIAQHIVAQNAQPIAAQWNWVAQCKAVEGLEAFVFPTSQPPLFLYHKYRLTLVTPGSALLIQ